MMSEGIPSAILRTWLEGRSLARKLPVPVADRGGFRVDTNSDTEVSRWVFPDISDGLANLANEITSPGYLLKACATPEQIRGYLPDGWTLGPVGYFMAASRDWPLHTLPEGYSIETHADGRVISAKVISSDGAVAASGYAAETDAAFVYDRIITSPEHRRRGLATVLINTLRQCRQTLTSPELLVATADGRRLYESLRWRTLSVYTTAYIAGD